MDDKKDFVRLNEELLKEWKEANARREECRFASDGIMFRGETVSYDGKCPCRRTSEDNKENKLWRMSPLRVLFITKDQNAGDGEPWDVRGETGRRSSNKIVGHFHRNLIRQLYAVYQTTREQKAIYDEQRAVELYDKCALARINVKKEAGSCSLCNSCLNRYLQRDAEFILKQVKVLDPNVIFCCGYSVSEPQTGNAILNFLRNGGYQFEPVFRNGEKNERDAWIFYDKATNRIAINDWHLSVRNHHDEMYDGLVDAYYDFLQKTPEFLPEKTVISK